MRRRGGLPLGDEGVQARSPTPHIRVLIYQAALVGSRPFQDLFVRVGGLNMVSKEVARGIGSTSRSKTYHRRGLWAIKKKNGGKFPTHPKKEKAPEAPAKVRGM